MTMTLNELGNILREEREKRGLLIDDVADHLKLSVRVIRALEEGDKESLPHAVYIRGFVTAYGGFLELDVEKLLKAEGLYNDIPPSKAAFEPAMTKERGGGKKLLFFLVFCICVAIAAFIWLQRDNDLFSNLKEDHLTTAQPAPPLSTQEKTPARVASSPAVTANPMPTQTHAAGLVQEQQSASSSHSGNAVVVAQNDASPASASANTVAQTSGAAADPERSPDNSQGARADSASDRASTQVITSPLALGAAPNAQEGTYESTQEGTTLVSSSDASGQEPTLQTEAGQSTTQTQGAALLATSEAHKVIITAVDECWIHSNADDTDTRQFSLRKGDTFALTFDESLVLKLGNAGGVRIHYDGKEMPIPGKDGEVKTIKFPPSV